MAQLKYKSIIPSSKPMWLLELQMWVSTQFYGCNYAGELHDFEVINNFIQENLKKLQPKMKSVVTTEIRTDEGKIVLFVKRNDRVVLTYYFE